MAENKKLKNRKRLGIEKAMNESMSVDVSMVFAFALDYKLYMIFLDRLLY